jgi:hypothetical protein
MPTIDDQAIQDLRIRGTARPDVDGVCRELGRSSYCFLPADRARSILLNRDKGFLHDWSAFRESWSRLPVDQHMADGGRYRRRRFAVLSAPASSLSVRLEPPQPHYQSLRHNRLNGGIARHFEPIEVGMLRSHSLLSIVTAGCEVFGRLAPYSEWHIEVHQFRIEAEAATSGLPTPEGRHRDGVSFAMMLMIKRINIAGGVTGVYDPEGELRAQITLSDPFDMLIVNDERIQHEVTPISQAATGRPGLRDVLVMTFRHTNRGG